ncbi:ferredoxin, 2Fe-2S [Salegentibacter agarivorans]|uniref:Ferredoxin, 2Fe-2S n=1 Tax=Salegentibacter agarivorans TaxID=345907 RepID=A0A1I2KQX7_9FLAO|nr:2Fe-2S iron-sulfur cluster-binding protein [Salegentibacter agarivorans]SFF67617.1 ferredoxin, 2Fe-2S [Salegentibacter agarivorans]
MAKVTFITSDNETIKTDGNSGNIMELAVKNNVNGIDGDCGGVCSCATCHVHVKPEFWEKVGEPGEMEQDMLEFDDNVSDYSRLGCQIPVTENIDGIVLNVAN